MTQRQHEGTLRKEIVRVKDHKVTRWIFDYQIGAEKRSAIIREDRVTVNGVVYDRWLADFGAVDGKRERKFFLTKPEAEQYVKTRAVELASRAESQVILKRKIGEDAAALSNDDLRDAVVGLKVLDRQGTLTDAATFYMQHTNPPGGKKTLDEVLNEYLAGKEKAGRRHATLINIRHRMGRLAEKFGAALVHTLTTQDLEAWLDQEHYKGVNRGNFKTIFTGFFNYCLKRNYARTNPATAIEKPAVDETIPTVFTPKQINHLMAVVAEEEPDMTPYFAIATFAGVRPNETRQLTWQDIDLNKKRIRVVPEVAKKRRQRYVDISDNLLMWLLPYRKNEGQIVYSRKAFERIIRASKLQWDADILRHSFASYHLAMYEDAAKTSLQLGHQNMGVLFNHYRDMVKREDAEEFWKIKPAEGKAIAGDFAKTA
jgi:integrase